MKFRLNCIAALCAALPVAALAQDDKTMGTVTVTEPRMLSPGETAIGETTLAPMRAATSDTARAGVSASEIAGHLYSGTTASACAIARAKARFCSIAAPFTYHHRACNPLACAAHRLR